MSTPPITDSRPTHASPPVAERIVLSAAAALLGVDYTTLRRWVRGTDPGHTLTASELGLQQCASEAATVLLASVERRLDDAVDQGPGQLRLAPSPRAQGTRPRRAWASALAPLPVPATASDAPPAPARRPEPPPEQISLPL